MRIINTALISSPENWWRVPIMAAIGLMAVYLLTKFVSVPESDNNAS